MYRVRCWLMRCWIVWRPSWTRTSAQACSKCGFPPGVDTHDEAISRFLLPKATLDTAHRQSTATERTLFRRLAVCVHAWTLKAAERVCDPDGCLGWEINSSVFLWPT